MPDDEYPPESIRVLAGLEPPVRDPDDPRVRWCREFLEDPREPLLPVGSDRVQAALEAIMRDCGLSEEMIRTRFPTALAEDDIERRPMGIHDALEAWAEGRLSVERALELTHAADVAEMIVLCHVNEVARPLLGGPVTRVALPVEDLSDAEMAVIMASRPIGPDYRLDDLPDVEARYPAEDGPGSGQRVELSVRVLVGLERSTVIVADPITGRALTREVLPHGREADVAAAAVEAAIRARLPDEET